MKRRVSKFVLGLSVLLMFLTLPQSLFSTGGICIVGEHPWAPKYCEPSPDGVGDVCMVFGDSSKPKCSGFFQFEEVEP